MAIRQALIHRYDNEADILAVETNGCSDVFKPGRIDFDLVIVIPTAAAKTELAVVADAASAQHKIKEQKHWPGSPGAKYKFRVDVRDVRYTTVKRVRQALINSGDSWVGAWTVKNANVEEDDLAEPDLEIDLPDSPAN